LSFYLGSCSLSSSRGPSVHTALCFFVLVRCEGRRHLAPPSSKLLSSPPFPFARRFSRPSVSVTSRISFSSHSGLVPSHDTALHHSHAFFVPTTFILTARSHVGLLPFLPLRRHPSFLPFLSLRPFARRQEARIDLVYHCLIRSTLYSEQAHHPPYEARTRSQYQMGSSNASLSAPLDTPGGNSTTTEKEARIPADVDVCEQSGEVGMVGARLGGGGRESSGQGRRGRLHEDHRDGKSAAVEGGGAQGGSGEEEERVGARDGRKEGVVSFVPSQGPLLKLMHLSTGSRRKWALLRHSL
jgi:hypothetical protein